MSIVSLIVVLVVVGLLLYLATSLPIDPTIKLVIKVLVILAVCLWLLEAFGILHVGTIRFGR